MSSFAKILNATIKDTLEEKVVLSSGYLDNLHSFPDTKPMLLHALVLEIAILWLISSSVIQTIFTFLMLSNNEAVLSMIQ